MTQNPTVVVVGVLALQGAFAEHLEKLRRASAALPGPVPEFQFIEVRTPEQLARCDALVIPGGESTTLAFVARQTGLLEPLRRFVKIDHKPTWGTCAGLILLADEATGAKKGGQELVGGLRVRAHRNHFGRQVHSFQADLALPFLRELGGDGDAPQPFPGVFIRAPVVETVLQPGNDGTGDAEVEVEVLGTVARRDAPDQEDVIAVRQGNIFATSFHPELTGDLRIHLWWLRQVLEQMAARKATLTPTATTTTTITTTQ